MSGRLKHAQRSHRNHTKAQKQMVDHSIKSATGQIWQKQPSS